jgi:catechol 2,3-dioxygenase-like lactoylglutathione lyase family enzyme
VLRLKALDHVGIICTDLQRSIEFYEALGSRWYGDPAGPVARR